MLLIVAPPSTICSTATNSFILYDNEFIYSPTNQVYAAGMLNNQFGVYIANGYNSVTSTSIWTASQTSTPTGAHFAAQYDGNLVVYANVGAIWNSGTATAGLMNVFCLQILDSGNLIWMDASNVLIWESFSATNG